MHVTSAYDCLGSTSTWYSRTGPIKFYNRGEPYYEFTNFYEALVNIDGQDWLTTEHYFQAQKFVGTPLVGTIRMLERPREAFEKSRDPRYSKWRRSDWEAVKEDVMYKALQAKFTQHEALRIRLMETGERQLIEHSPHDSYWGDGGNGTGKNRLGELLMRLRREMKEKQSVHPPPSPPPVHPDPPKRQNSSSSNAPNTDRGLDQCDKDLAGQPTTQTSAPSPPRDRTESPPNATVIPNEAAGAGLATDTGQKYNVIFTPANSQTLQPDTTNQSDSHQPMNDLPCSTITPQQSASDDLMGIYQIREEEKTTLLTRKPLGSELTPGHPERVLSPSSYADAVRGLQCQICNFPPLGMQTAHTQPQNNSGGGNPQPESQNNPGDEPMDTSTSV